MRNGVPSMVWLHDSVLWIPYYLPQPHLLIIIFGDDSPTDDWEINTPD